MLLWDWTALFPFLFLTGWTVWPICVRHIDCGCFEIKGLIYNAFRKRFKHASFAHFLIADGSVGQLRGFFLAVFVGLQSFKSFLVIPVLHPSILELLTAAPTPIYTCSSRMSSLDGWNVICRFFSFCIASEFLGSAGLETADVSHLQGHCPCRSLQPHGFLCGEYGLEQFLSSCSFFLGKEVGSLYFSVLVGLSQFGIQSFPIFAISPQIFLRFRLCHPRAFPPLRMLPSLGLCVPSSTYAPRRRCHLCSLVCSTRCLPQGSGTGIPSKVHHTAVSHPTQKHPRRHPRSEGASKLDTGGDRLESKENKHPFLRKMSSRTAWKGTKAEQIQWNCENRRHCSCRNTKGKPRVAKPDANWSLSGKGRWNGHTMGCS